MTDTLPEFNTKFQTSNLEILRINYWTWSVRPVHCTLGAGILFLNRFCPSFGSLTDDEATELGVIVRELENRLKTLFQPDKFNYMMLMMVDRHLHFHVIPRYEAVRSFGGIEWKDAGWPALPQLADGGQLQQDPILLKIRDQLRGA